MTMQDNDFQSLDPTLQALDDALARLAAAEPFPQAVTDRVFRASASLLPGNGVSGAACAHGAHGAHGPQGMAARVRVRRWTFSGRLALAASMGLAFLIAIRALQRPVPGDFTFDFIPISVGTDVADDLGASDPVTELGGLTFDDLEGELAAIQKAMHDRPSPDS